MLLYRQTNINVSLVDKVRNVGCSFLLEPPVAVNKYNVKYITKNIIDFI